MRRGPFSDSYAPSDDTVYLPGFLRFDAGIYAQVTDTWKARLDIENIFNKGRPSGVSLQVSLALQQSPPL